MQGGENWAIAITDSNDRMTIEYIQYTIFIHWFLWQRDILSEKPSAHYIAVGKHIPKKAMAPNRRRRRRSVSNSSSNPESAPRRRRSSRGNSSLSELAKEICLYRKKVLFITGAGISVASGVRPFRGSSGVWTQHIWSTATREAFRKDPLEWYNEFCTTM